MDVWQGRGGLKLRRRPHLRLLVDCGNILVDSPHPRQEGMSQELSETARVLGASEGLAFRRRIYYGSTVVAQGNRMYT